MVFTFANYTAPTIGDYSYDTFGNAIGWTIAMMSVIPIPVVAIYQLCKAKGSFLQVSLSYPSSY